MPKFRYADDEARTYPTFEAKPGDERDFDIPPDPRWIEMDNENAVSIPAPEPTPEPAPAEPAPEGA